MKLLVGIFALFLAACGDEPVESIENDPELGVIAQATEFAVAPDLLYTRINPPAPWYDAVMVTWLRAQPNTDRQVMYYPAGTTFGTATGAIQTNMAWGDTCWTEGAGFGCSGPAGYRHIACPHWLGANTKDSYRMTQTSTLRAWGAAYPLIRGTPAVMPMSGGETRVVNRSMRCGYQWTINTWGHYIQVSNP